MRLMFQCLLFEARFFWMLGWDHILVERVTLKHPVYVAYNAKLPNRLPITPALSFPLVDARKNLASRVVLR
jgi:hypothetical protein